MCATLLLSGWGGCFSPARCGAIPSLMVLAFPALALLALIYIAVLAIARWWKHVVACAAALLLVMPQLHAVLPVNVTSVTPAPNATTIKVATYNVGGLHLLSKCDSSSVIRRMLDINADVVLVQELPHTDNVLDFDNEMAVLQYSKELKEKYPYHSHVQCDDVGIFSKFPFVTDTIVAPQRGFDTLNYYKDMEHYNVFAFDIVVNGHPLRLISAHLRSWGLSVADKSLAGSSELAERDVLKGSAVYEMPLMKKLERAFALRAGEAETLRKAIDGYKGDLIVCGDFNDVAGSYAYRTVKGDDLTDVWVERGMGYGNTYCMHHMYFKIDHILYRGNLRPLDVTINKSRIGDITDTDHYPVITVFEIINQNITK